MILTSLIIILITIALVWIGFVLHERVIEHRMVLWGYCNILMSYLDEWHKKDGVVYHGSITKVFCLWYLLFKPYKTKYEIQLRRVLPPHQVRTKVPSYSSCYVIVNTDSGTVTLKKRGHTTNMFITTEVLSEEHKMSLGEFLSYFKNTYFSYDDYRTIGQDNGILDKLVQDTTS